MINEINLRRLRNAEYIQFLKNVVEIVVDNDPTTLNVVEKLTALQGELSGLETLFKLNKSSQLSPEIVALDLRRDRAISGLRSIIKGYTMHFNPDFVAAAKRLDASFDLYGNGIVRQNYQAETAIINGLLNDWTIKPELSDSVLLLGLNAWRDELKTSNDLFDATYVDRAKEHGTKTTDSVTTERAETTEAYNDLKKRIEAANTMNSTPAHTKTMNELNGIIDNYNTLLANRNSDDGNPENGES